MGGLQVANNVPIRWKGSLRLQALHQPLLLLRLHTLQKPQGSEPPMLLSWTACKPCSACYAAWKMQNLVFGG